MKRPNDAKNLISNVILVVLVAVSVFLAGALAARYLTSGTGSDTARVAKWDVSAAVTAPTDPADPAIMVIAPDGSVTTANYQIDFTNNSEVSARGTVEITGMPSGMKAYVRESASGTGTELTSSTGWNIAMNGGTKTIYIYFTAASTVASDQYSITITPVFTQID